MSRFYQLIFLLKHQNEVVTSKDLPGYMGWVCGEFWTIKFQTLKYLSGRLLYQSHRGKCFRIRYLLFIFLSFCFLFSILYLLSIRMINRFTTIIIIMIIIIKSQKKPDSRFWSRFHGVYLESYNGRLNSTYKVIYTVKCVYYF